MADDLREFAGKLDRLAANLSGPQMDSTLLKVVSPSKKDWVEAKASDLGGDGRMSRWPLAPFDIDSKLTGHASMNLFPTPRSRGPVRVAESGRKSGMSRGRSGARGGKFVAPRRVSASRGLNTWTDFGRLLDTRTTARLLKAIDSMVEKTLGR